MWQWHMMDIWYSFFFNINILLHRARWQTIVATFITTYSRSRYTWGVKGKEKAKRKKEKGKKESRTNQNREKRRKLDTERYN